MLGNGCAGPAPRGSGSGRSRRTSWEVRARAYSTTLDGSVPRPHRGPSIQVSRARYASLGHGPLITSPPNAGVYLPRTQVTDLEDVASGPGFEIICRNRTSVYYVLRTRRDETIKASRQHRQPSVIPTSTENIYSQASTATIGRRGCCRIEACPMLHCLPDLHLGEIVGPPTTDSEILEAISTSPQGFKALARCARLPPTEMTPPQREANQHQQQSAPRRRRLLRTEDALDKTMRHGLCRLRQLRLRHEAAAWGRAPRSTHPRNHGAWMDRARLPSTSTMLPFDAQEQDETQRQRRRQILPTQCRAFRILYNQHSVSGINVGPRHAFSTPMTVQSCRHRLTQDLLLWL